MAHVLPGWCVTPVALAAVLGVASTACTSSSSTGLSGPPPTSVSLDPSYFLGSASCSSQPGCLQSYVATLIDVTNPDATFVLPSSLATACSVPTELRFVVPGHEYAASIDGYDVAADALIPCGGQTTGSRRMLPLGEGSCQTKAVAPRWTAACGQALGTEAVSIANANVVVGGCDALVDHGSSPTAIVLDPNAALGALGCKTASDGEVAMFDVTPLDGATAPVVGLTCGAPPIRIGSGLEAGASYSFYVAARAAAGKPASWGSTCHATAVEGLSVAATCDPLSAKGGIRIDVPGLYEAAGIACKGGAPAVVITSVTNDGTAVEILAPPSRCDTDERVGPLTAGTYSLALATHDEAGADLLSARCTATIEPGLTANASCTATH